MDNAGCLYDSSVDIVCTFQMCTGSWDKMLKLWSTGRWDLLPSALMLFPQTVLVLQACQTCAQLALSCSLLVSIEMMSLCALCFISDLNMKILVHWIQIIDCHTFYYLSLAITDERKLSSVYKASKVISLHF